MKKAIHEGIESVRAIDFDPKKHLEYLKSKGNNNFQKNFNSSELALYQSSAEQQSSIETGRNEIK